MAELPRYKEKGDLLVSPGTFTDAPIKESMVSNERLNKFLGQASEYFRNEAVDYATDQAIEYAIRNPITREQLTQAQQTGDNPINKYLQGGVVYNEALTKVLGQQIAGELNLELNKHQSNVLEQVRLGNIANDEQMLAKLKEPIQAQIEFFGNIDPELAQQYGANAARITQNYYLQGGKIFEEKREQQAYNNGLQTLDNAVNNYNNYLETHPNATAEQKQIYKETELKVASDHAFSMSRQQTKLTESLRNELDLIEDDYVAKEIANKYAGKDIAEVLKELPKDGSNAADYYNDKDILEQDNFRNRIQRYLTLNNAGQQAVQQEVTYNVGLANDYYLTKGLPIPPELADKINQNIKTDTVQYKRWQSMQKVSSNISTWNQTAYPVLVNAFESLDNKLRDIEDPAGLKDLDDLVTRDVLGAYLAQLNKDLQNDTVGTILKRAGEYEELDFANSNKLRNQLDARNFNMKKYGSMYGMNEAQINNAIMTKGEVDSFMAQYMGSDEIGRVALLDVIDDGFADKNSVVLQQLIKAGLPISAELSSYFGNPNLTAQFMSYDNPEEQKRLKQAAMDKNTSIEAIRKEVRKELKDFETVVMGHSNYNTSAVAEKMDRLTTILSYQTINQMLLTGDNSSVSAKKAAELITNNFIIEDTYYIPSLYDKNPTVPERIKDKADLIQKKYVMDFKPVPFASSDTNIDDEMLQEALEDNIEDNGQWRNTPDGTGLYFGIVMADGSFAPLQNANGDYLMFKFNDLTFKLPYTNIEMDMKKIPNTFGYRIGG
jgi:hypothetical protein